MARPINLRQWWEKGNKRKRIPTLCLYRIRTSISLCSQSTPAAAAAVELGSSGFGLRQRRRSTCLQHYGIRCGQLTTRTNCISTIIVISYGRPTSAAESAAVNSTATHLIFMNTDWFVSQRAAAVRTDWLPLNTIGLQHRNTRTLERMQVLEAKSYCNLNGIFIRDGIFNVDVDVEHSSPMMKW